MHTLNSGGLYVAVSAENREKEPMLGLFARKRFEKGETITEYGGELVTDTWALTNIEWCVRIPRTDWVLDGRRFSEAFDRKELAVPPFDRPRFPQGEHAALIMSSGIGYMCNVSIAPGGVNARSKTIDAVFPPRLVLVATKAIDAHQEIFIRYGNSFERELRRQRRCERKKTPF